MASVGVVVGFVDVWVVVDGVFAVPLDPTTLLVIVILLLLLLLLVGVVVVAVLFLL
jgi:hypothetical protein